MIESLVLLDGTHEVVPVKVGIEDILSDIHLLQNLMTYRTHLAEHLSGTCLQYERLAENVVVRVVANHDAGIYAQTLYDVQYITLQLIE